MNTQEKPRDPQTDPNKTSKYTDQQKQINPRLVFNDPDLFFQDLLMEQQEQS